MVWCLVRRCTWGLGLKFQGGNGVSKADRLRNPKRYGGPWCDLWATLIGSRQKGLRAEKRPRAYENA